MVEVIVVGYALVGLLCACLYYGYGPGTPHVGGAVFIVPLWPLVIMAIIGAVEDDPDWDWSKEDPDGGSE